MTNACRWAVVAIGGHRGATTLAVVDRTHRDDLVARVRTAERFDVDMPSPDDQADTLRSLTATWRADGYAVTVLLSRLPGVGRAVEDIYRESPPSGVSAVSHPVPSDDPADDWRTTLVASLYLARTRRQLVLDDATLDPLLTTFMAGSAAPYDMAVSPTPGDPTGLALPVAVGVHYSHPDRQARVHSPAGVHIPRGAGDATDDRVLALAARLGPRLRIDRGWW